MLADLAWQRQELQSLLQRDRGDRHSLRDRGALRLLAVAELHEGTEATVARGHGLAGRGILAEQARAVLADRAGVSPSPSGVGTPKGRV